MKITEDFQEGNFSFTEIEDRISSWSLNRLNEETEELIKASWGERESPFSPLHDALSILMKEYKKRDAMSTFNQIVEQSL